MRWRRSCGPPKPAASPSGSRSAASATTPTANFHRALLETKNVKLVAAITGTREKGVKLAKLHGFPEASIYSYEQWDQVAANPAIDIVYVVTPPGVHRRNVLDAFGAGKHVICEKPMATSVADCDAMIARRQARRQAARHRLPSAFRSFIIRNSSAWRSRRSSVRS